VRFEIASLKNRIILEIYGQEKLAGWVARTRPPNAKTLPLNGLLFSAPQKVPIKQVNRYHGSIGFLRKYRFNRYRYGVACDILGHYSV
jgi:hypothetical protein